MQIFYSTISRVGLQNLSFGLHKLFGLLAWNKPCSPHLWESGVPRGVDVGTVGYGNGMFPYTVSTKHRCI